LPQRGGSNLFGVLTPTRLGKITEQFYLWHFLNTSATKRLKKKDKTISSKILFVKGYFLKRNWLKYGPALNEIHVA